MDLTQLMRYLACSAKSGYLFGDLLVKQRNKTRPIDDFRENTLNQTFGSVERAELRTMDHVLWSLVVLAQYLSFHEHMRFVLGDGEVLEGETPTCFQDYMRGFTNAYKQLAAHPTEQKRSVVTLWNHREQKPVCYVSRVLLYSLVQLLVCTIFSGQALSCKQRVCTWACPGQHTLMISL